MDTGHVAGDVRLPGDHSAGRKTMQLRLRQIILLSVILLVGCTLPSRRWKAPGPIGLQQLEATRFDPYGDADAGPEIVGGRPREYQRPASEPVRARRFQETRWPF